MAREFTGTTLGNYRGKSPKVSMKPKILVSCGSAIPSPSLHSPFEIPSPRRVLHSVSGESVLDVFNGLGHHWGNLLCRLPAAAAAHWRQVGTGGACAVRSWPPRDVRGSMAACCGV